MYKTSELFTNGLAIDLTIIDGVSGQILQPYEANVFRDRLSFQQEKSAKFGLLCRHVHVWPITSSTAKEFKNKILIRSLKSFKVSMRSTDSIH